MNVDAFLAVADVIEYADRFDLSVFATAEIGSEAEMKLDRGDPQNEIIWNDCGTTACVAGWVNAWADNPNAQDVRAASAELGIEDRVCWRLFAPDANSVWARLASEYGWKRDSFGSVSPSLQITAAQAADVLRRIARGEVEL